MSIRSEMPPRFVPHRIFTQFFGGDFVATLLEFAASRQSRGVASSVGSGDQSCVDRNGRRSVTLGTLGPHAAAFEASVRARLPEISGAIGVTPADLPAAEISLVAHNDGDFYRRHLDTFTSNEPSVGGPRVISLVYYFYREPKGFDGGNLRLYSFRSSNEYVDIIPTQDTLVAFPSFLPHEVLPVVCQSGHFMDSRFAVNCWLARQAPHPPG